MIRYYVTDITDGKVFPCPPPQAVELAMSEDYFVVRINYTTQEAHWIDCSGHAHLLELNND